MIFLLLAKSSLGSFYVEKNINLLSQIDSSSTNTLQILTHGKPGFLFINNEWKNAEAIVRFLEPKLQGVNQINIYGCEFGKGTVGEDAVHYIERQLNVRVGASNNLTGVDGDWTLEVGHPFHTISFPEFQGNLQSGTVSSPYTSIAQAACNTTPGIKYFNIGGVAFSTYVNSQGYLLVANDFSSNSGTLAQTTALTTSGYGILSAAVMAKLGATQQIRIQTGDGKVDEITSAAGNITRLVNFQPLVQGNLTAADNLTWVNLGTDPNIQFAGTACNSQYSSWTLAESIIHPCGNGTSFNWIPRVPFHYEYWNVGISPATSFTMWVSGIAQPVNSTTAKTICQGQMATLDATCTDSIVWYTNPNAMGTPVYNNNALVSPSTTTSYYPQCKSAGCLSAVGLPEVVTVKDTPTITGNSNICRSSTTTTLNGSASPGTAPSWTSSNPAVATVVSTSSVNSLVTPVSLGTTIITYKNSLGCTTSKTITITEPTINGNTNLCLGTTSTLTSPDPPAATSPWVSSSPTIATISSTGVVTPVASGTTNITYTNASGCKKTVAITVNTRPTSPTGIKDSAFCPGAAFNLNWSASCSAGNTLTWYSDAALTTTVSANQYANAPTTFYASCVNNTTGCKSPGVAKSISILPSPTLTTSFTNPLCAYGLNGTITATAAGGSGSPYTYSKDNGLTSQTANVFTSLGDGTYWITAYDSKGCVSSPKNVTLTSPNSISFYLSTYTAVLCAGTTTGSIAIVASSGTPPYTYSVNNGATYQTSNTFSNLPPGNYNIIVKDANGCTSYTSNSPITQATPVTQTYTKTNVLCNGASTGILDITGSGGAAPHTYSINNGVSYQPFGYYSGLAAGTYTIVVKDYNGCTSTPTTITITQPPAVTQTNTKTNVLCNGTSTGTITVTGAGGTAPYTYSKDNGVTYQTSNTFSGLAIGPYSIIVKDANGCKSTPSIVSITQPNVVMQTNTITNVLCNGASTGAVAVTASGGTPPYTYSKDNGATYQTSSTLSGLPAGSYTIVVKDANGCTSPPAAVTITQASAVTQTNTPTNILCNGASTGAIAVTGAGGTAPYTYSNDNGATFQTSSTFSGLAAGSYTIVVKDANGCTSTPAAVTITQASAVTQTNTPTNILCNGASTGAIAVTGAGGTAPYTYSNDNGATFQTSSTFASLPAGSYTIVVKDANGCTSTPAAVTITQATAVTQTNTPTNVLCNGASTGAIAVTGAGGTAPYSYSKDNGANYQTSSTFSGLPAGSYTIVVKDANGCTSTPAAVTITQATAVTQTNTPTNILCNGASTGAIAVTGAGGTAPYTYSKDNGATFQTSSTFSGLSAGSYTIVVKDANGCTSTPAVVTITQATSVTQTNSITNVLCNGASTGAIAVTGAGGTAPYTYSKDNGATFQTASTFSGLAAGSYTIVVKDANGCTSTPAAVTITQASAVTQTNTPTNILCNGASTGAIAVTGAGGTAPYTYSNDNGATFQTSSTFSGLAAGSYTIVVKDANGCTSTPAAVTITQATAVTQTNTPTNILCNGASTGAIAVTGAGGTVPYTYSKDNGANYQTSSTFFGLPAGSYTIVVRDANGCTSTPAAVTITQATAVTQTNTPTNVLCNGASTGAIAITGAGGTAPYSYSKDNGATFQTSSTFSGLPAGSYTIVVKDANGCTSTPAAVTITQATAVTQTNTPTNVLCNGASTGAIAITGAGGTAPYTYSKDNGATFQTASTFSGLPAGSYTIVVRDANGCTSTPANTIVTQPLVVSFSTSVTQVNCQGTNTGSITINGSGGSGVYSYSINGGTSYSSTGIFSNLPAGTYTIKVKDENNCVSIDSSITLNYMHAKPNGVLVGSTICEGQVGQLTLNSSAGTGPFSLIINGTTYNNINSGVPFNVTQNPSTTTSYNLTQITDSNGCVNP